MQYNIWLIDRRVLHRIRRWLECLLDGSKDLRLTRRRMEARAKRRLLRLFAENSKGSYI